MTYSEIHPSAVHDGESDKGHHADTHQEVADGQVHDQHRRHRVESLGRSHDDDDKNITYAERHTHTQTHSARTHTQVGIQITTMQKDKNQIRGSLDYLSQSSFTCMIFLFNTHCMSEV